MKLGRGVVLSITGSWLAGGRVMTSDAQSPAARVSQGKLYYTSGATGALGRANLDGSQNEPLIPMAGNLTGIALGVLP